MAVAANVFVSMMSAPGLEIGVMNVGDDLRAGEHQEIDVVLHRDGVIPEPFAAHVAFFQLVLLHHGSHGAVEDAGYGGRGGRRAGRAASLLS